MVLELSGRMRVVEPVMDLQSVVRDAIGAGQRRLALDLGAVESIDSTGLSQLAACYAMVTKAGGEIRLIRPNERVRNVLRIMSMLRIFDTFEDESSALASFSKNA
jgi:anti-sigma B factor antagonist